MTKTVFALDDIGSGDRYKLLSGLVVPVPSGGSATLAAECGECRVLETFCEGISLL